MTLFQIQVHDAQHPTSRQDGNTVVAMRDYAFIPGLMAFIDTIHILYLLHQCRPSAQASAEGNPTACPLYRFGKGILSFHDQHFRGILHEEYAASRLK